MYDFGSVWGLVWPTLVFWPWLLILSVVVVLILIRYCCYCYYVERKWMKSWNVVLLKMIGFVSWDVVADDDDDDNVEMW